MESFYGMMILYHYFCIGNGGLNTEGQNLRGKKKGEIIFFIKMDISPLMLRRSGGKDPSKTNSEGIKNFVWVTHEAGALAKKI